VLEQLWVLPGGAGGFQLVQVEAGAEAAALRSQHHHAQRGVLRQLGQVALQCQQVFAVQPVEMPRAVQRDRGATGVVQRQQRRTFGRTHVVCGR
jgi:hypothetical protein